MLIFSPHGYDAVIVQIVLRANLNTEERPAKIMIDVNCS